jgi:hypothetical protein
LNAPFPPLNTKDIPVSAGIFFDFSGMIANSSLILTMPNCEMQPAAGQCA